MEENSEVQEILAQLADKELSYVMARRHLFSNLKSAEKAGLSKEWWYSLTSERQAQLNIFADRLRRADAKAVIASNILNDAVEDAAGVLVNSLKDRDARLRLAASNSLLDRVIPRLAPEINGTVNVNVNDLRAEIQRKLAGIAVDTSEE